MNPLLKTLLNTRTLRKTLNEATPEQIETLLANVILVSDEIKEIHRKKAEEDAIKLQELELFKQQIIDKGIDFEALSKIMTGKQKAKKKTATAQTELIYHYEKDGEKKQWNGKGDMPNIIKQAIHNGSKLTDFLAR
ncbi:H-NS family histone-like protein [Aliivibrio fischeri]|uniref:DNA-binding protein n=1 Tax=Aliivibrio fischeri TaxID=668 RepID=A0A510UM51_ALIFS|nr:H-NS family nucleoid-associated regulatory protein [Aliivibrio fischeri]GEK15743.1 hypothetical protein AFI02nite_37790 [Aliivibrio fischeri]